MSGEFVKPVMLSRLHDAYGKVIELSDDEGHELVYYIKAEFQLGDKVYAALQTEEMRQEEDVDIFIVAADGDELQLESIEDEEEWEMACEVYDDLQFTKDERP